MNSYERFHTLLKRDFFPLLRADGFKGSGNNFRRVKGEKIDLLNVQGSVYGGKCCVNLAVHYFFLPTEGGRTILDPKKLKHYECTFRDRLHEANESDHWWPYGADDDDATAEENVADLINMYQRRGTTFFRSFEPFPDVFERVTPEQLDSGDVSRMPADINEVSAASTMSYIMKHLGRYQECSKFARVALRHCSASAGIRRELERLRDIDKAVVPANTRAPARREERD